jgi:hypothetical protein
VAPLVMDCATKEDQDWIRELVRHGFVDVDWDWRSGLHEDICKWVCV